MSGQGTAWNAVENRIFRRDDTSEGKNQCLIKEIEGGCIEAHGSNGEAHYCNVLTSNTNQQ